MSDTKPAQTDERVNPAVGEEPFLERWSRRKRGHDTEDATGKQAESVTAVSTPDTTTEEPVLTDADMPPIDSLDSDSDYSPFMSPGVSEQLRTRALRKLFHQPAFNITDGLNDYDEDFTRFAGLGDTVTHEMKRILQRELQERPNAEEQLIQNTDESLPDEAATGKLDAQQDDDDDSDALT